MDFISPTDYNIAVKLNAELTLHVRLLAERLDDKNREIRQLRDERVGFVQELRKLKEQK